MARTILVTGGAGFIGSNFVLQRIAAGDRVITLDKLTDAGNLGNLSSLDGHSAHLFVQGGIEDETLLRMLLLAHRPEAIVNFATERRMDRSIANPEEFVLTSVMGTYRLLQESLAYYRSLPGESQSRFRFLHVSSDEVYGSLDPCDPAFGQAPACQPGSPYSASKAGSDPLVRAFQHSYHLPTLTTNCSRNYGPYQGPEKLIPLLILNALNGRPLAVYEDGLCIRDWLYVGDHCDAISVVMERGAIGETYNVGGDSEKTNHEVVSTICSIMDDLHPAGAPHHRLMTFVKCRPLHDRRYAIDASKLHNELDWRPRESFDSGIRRTIEWYLSNLAWVEQVSRGDSRKWIAANYEFRGPETRGAESPASTTPASASEYSEPHSAIKDGR